jgi:hypothetical protein
MCLGRLAGRRLTGRWLVEEGLDREVEFGLLRGFFVNDREVQLARLIVLKTHYLY